MENAPHEARFPFGGIRVRLTYGRRLLLEYEGGFLSVRPKRPLRENVRPVSADDERYEQEAPAFLGYEAFVGLFEKENRIPDRNNEPTPFLQLVRKLARELFRRCGYENPVELPTGNTDFLSGKQDFRMGEAVFTYVRPPERYEFGNDFHARYAAGFSDDRR